MRNVILRIGVGSRRAAARSESEKNERQVRVRSGFRGELTATAARRHVSQILRRSIAFVTHRRQQVRQILALRIRAARSILRIRWKQALQRVRIAVAALKTRIAIRISLRTQALIASLKLKVAALFRRYFRRPLRRRKLSAVARLLWVFEMVTRRTKRKLHPLLRWIRSFIRMPKITREYREPFYLIPRRP